MKSRSIFLYAVLIPFLSLLLNSPGSAQTFLDSLNLYSSLRVHIASYDQKAEMQDNGSRIGFLAGTDLTGGIKMIGTVELAMRLIENSIELNLNNVTESDHANITVGSPPEVFSLRLAYLGFDLGEYGSLFAGKQWSVYYDVSGWTDMFYVFGGSAGGTYSGTDGGATGTGRAERSLIYRNSFGPVKIGLQTQFKVTEVNGLENFGFSLRYSLLKQLSLGASLNGYRLPASAVEQIIGADDKKRVLGFGALWSDERLYAAAHYSIHNSNEFVSVGDTISVAYDATGYELFAQYALFDKLKLHAGFNYLNPKDVQQPADPDLRTLYYVIGAAYYFNPKAFLYIEYRIDDSIGNAGGTIMNVFTFGARLDWNWLAVGG